MLRTMMGNVAKKLGFENPDTIFFCRMCENPASDMFYIIEVYKQLMNS